MSDNPNREEASELGKRASKQGKNAAKNAGKAVQVAAEPVLEEAEEKAEEAVRTAKRINPLGLSRLTGNTGQGFLALSVAIFAGTFAVNKFRGVYMTRNQVVMPKRPYVPSEPAA